ncbi:MAG: hypothetical protein V1704_04350 [Candidatus Vogelbacteria bacterium]
MIEEVPIINEVATTTEDIPPVNPPEPTEIPSPEPPVVLENVP